MINALRFLPVAATAVLLAVSGYFVKQGIDARAHIAVLEEKLSKQEETFNEQLSIAKVEAQDIEHEAKETITRMAQANARIQQNLKELNARIIADVKLRDAASGLVLFQDIALLRRAISELGDVYQQCRAEYRQLGQEAAGLAEAIAAFQGRKLGPSSDAAPADTTELAQSGFVKSQYDTSSFDLRDWPPHKVKCYSGYPCELNGFIITAPGKVIATPVASDHTGNYMLNGEKMPYITPPPGLLPAPQARPPQAPPAQKWKPYKPPTEWSI